VTASVGVQAFLFDIGWGELVLIGVVALIVFGPKELPVVLRTVGQYMAKIRRMAGEFQSQFQEAMREAEMAELKQHFDTIQDAAKDLRSFDPVSTVRNQVETAAAEKPADAAPSNTAASAPATEPPADQHAGTAVSASAPPEPPAPVGAEPAQPAGSTTGGPAAGPTAAGRELETGKGQPG
jgi:sec-independent protein translocase protein TatB